MSRSDDNGWNLVRLPEDQKTISSSRLLVDLVSEESHVDDDILSNTSSSDELAEFSFRTATESHGGVQDVSDSFDTLTGSKTAVVERGSKEVSWSFKTWQVMVLTSLISVSLSLGVQRYWNLSVADVSTGGGGGEMAVIYPDLSFLTAVDADANGHGGFVDTIGAGAGAGAGAVADWKPTGKFYVDFDNRIAYPMPEEGMFGWKRCKADSMILWYTAKSKALGLLKTETFKSLEGTCRGMLVLVADEAARIRDKLWSASLACRGYTAQVCHTSFVQVRRMWLQLNVKTFKSRERWHAAFKGARHRALTGVRYYNKKMHRKANLWRRRTVDALRKNMNGRK